MLLLETSLALALWTLRIGVAHRANRQPNGTTCDHATQFERYPRRPPNQPLKKVVLLRSRKR